MTLSPDALRDLAAFQDEEASFGQFWGAMGMALVALSLYVVGMAVVGFVRAWWREHYSGRK